MGQGQDRNLGCKYWELDGKEPACNAGDPGVWSLGQQDTLEKGMGTHSCLENSMTVEPGGLRFAGLHRVGHDWVTDTHTHTHTHTH